MPPNKTSEQTNKQMRCDGGQGGRQEGGPGGKGGGGGGATGRVRQPQITYTPHCPNRADIFGFRNSANRSLNSFNFGQECLCFTREFSLILNLK